MNGPMPDRQDFVSIVRGNLLRLTGRAFTFVREGHRRGGVVEHPQERLGFVELDLRARTIARLLQERDMPGRPALLLYPAGLDFLAAFLGCLYAQVIAVPLPPPGLDPGALDRARGVIADTDADLILTDTGLQPTIEAWLHEIGRADVQCIRTDADLAACPDEWAEPDIDPSTPAVLQYTSGSTSDPKGVILTHGNLKHVQEELRHFIDPAVTMREVGWLPHYHVMGLIGGFGPPLYFGFDYVFTAPITFIKRPVLWLELISRHRATITLAPNFGYELLLRQVTDDQLTGLDLSSLLITLNGAEPLRPAVLDRMVERFGAVGFSADKWTPCYGMTEATLVIASAPPRSGPVVRSCDDEELALGRAVASAPGTGRQLVSSGRAATLDLRVVEPATAKVMPDEHIGEIWVRGPSVAHGYWRRPDQTRETFHARTADGEGPYLRTGDLGFLAGGELVVTGRIKDMVIVNGRNLYPADIESVAAQTHPAALESAAFAVDTGKEEVVVVQEIDPARLGETPLDELTATIKSAVVRGFGVTAVSVVLCRQAALPRTVSGKIRRQVARDTFLAAEFTELASDLEPGIIALRAVTAERA